MIDLKMDKEVVKKLQLDNTILWFKFCYQHIKILITEICYKTNFETKNDFKKIKWFTLYQFKMVHLLTPLSLPLEIKVITF